MHGLWSQTKVYLCAFVFLNCASYLFVHVLKQPKLFKTKQQKSLLFVFTYMETALVPWPSPSAVRFWDYSFQHQARFLKVIFVNSGKCSHDGRYPPKTAPIWGDTGGFGFSDYGSVTDILPASIHTHTREQSSRSHFPRGLWIGSKLSTHFSRNSELNPLERSMPGWLSLDHGCHLCHIWTVLWNQYWCQEGLTSFNMEYNCFEFMKDKC